jgi:hypothetical protein
MFFFLIKDRPGPPTSIAVSRCSPTSTTIAWRSSADNNDPVVEYLVEYSSISGGPAADSVDRPISSFRSAVRLRVADYERELQTPTRPPSTTVTPTTRVKKPASADSEMEFKRSRLARIASNCSCDTRFSVGFARHDTGDLTFNQNDNVR